MPCSPDFLNWALHVWGSKKAELTQPADAWGTLRLKLLSFWPRTDKGKEDNGQPTFFGYNPPFNPSRTKHILMSTALLLCCKQISVLHEFDSADHRPLLCHFCQCCYHTLICDFRVRFGEAGKENIKYMVWGDENKDAFVSHWKWDRPPIFSELYLQSRTSILPQTLPRSHCACCWCHWYDSKTNVAQSAAGPSQGPLV